MTTPRLRELSPGEARHRLVYAAVGADEAKAVQALRDWLNSHDLDDAVFSEHRLLAAIVERFGSAISDLPEYPRLTGLQRQIWTKSRMAAREAVGALTKMDEAGLKVVLLKGAARIAKNPEEQKSRTAYDVDILLSEHDFPSAAGILFSDGWQSDRGESRKALEARLMSLRNRNFVKGRFGDIDLHRSAYPKAFANVTADASLFSGLQPARYFDVPVFLPGPEERLAIAIAHGVRDAGSEAGHSDWLIDCARILRDEGVSWPEFLTVARQRKLRAYALGALSYLRSEIGCPVPDNVLAQLRGSGPAGVLRDAAGSVSMQRKAALGVAGRAVRAGILVLQQANSIKRRKVGESPRVFGFAGLAPVRMSGPAMGVRHALNPPDPGRYRFHLVLEAELPGTPRRVEFELNTAARNVCNLYLLKLAKPARARRLHFRGRFDVRPGDHGFEIEARPGRVIHGGEDEDYLAKYGTVAFRVVKWAPRRSR